ncbi:SDR family NAD(P)-dependent oxidoreductase [Halomonas alimentaria]|uniref:SDR family NAD(P)-dependent oxidoreductase n=1 Tax=Halomonas alimentaria TaxID=147248 RepID=UPI0030B83636
MPATPPQTTRSLLITGCSSGIGHAAAHAMAERGWRVFATARKAEDVARLREEGFEALTLDLDSSASIEAAVASVAQRTGDTLTALFNNGAYGQPGAVEDLSRDVLRQQLETNLLGTHELTTRVLPMMRAQGHGRIVHNSSVLGFAALPYRGAYVCSKFALEGLTDTLRQELLGSGIHISLIQPGPITSRFRENAHRAFRANIDTRHSAHAETYHKVEARLASQDGKGAFTLGPAMR